MSAAVDLFALAAAALKRCPPIDPRAVAPEDWQYLGDLAPEIELRFAFRLASVGDAERIELTREQIGAIKDAVRTACAGTRIGPEDRFDFQQELALKLLKHGAPQSLEGWLHVVAGNLVRDWLRTEKAHRELQAELRRRGAPPPYFGSRRRDPLASYMRVKRPPRVCGRNKVEDATIEAIDDRTEHGIGWTSRETPDGRKAWTRNESQNSTPDTQKSTGAIRVGSSSFMRRGF